ncbi:MAG: hypothetical protein EOS52_03595 [Mesorhizobium sp.]|uniref:hypothetical protein n=1 Tax=Mesorhizobium sp. TaxID=1871066 RepID=UPI000FE45A9C|nr:hypothetical protein [Mesorhizobium sp.]RWC17147.1 MAG: hypothetical protein EOS52_03595 [Mesorhizobium sp.]
MRAERSFAIAATASCWLDNTPNAQASPAGSSGDRHDELESVLPILKFIPRLVGSIKRRRLPRALMS